MRKANYSTGTVFKAAFWRAWYLDILFFVLRILCFVSWLVAS